MSQTICKIMESIPAFVWVFLVLSMIMFVVVRIGLRREAIREIKGCIDSMKRGHTSQIMLILDTLIHRVGIRKCLPHGYTLLELDAKAEAKSSVQKFEDMHLAYSWPHQFGSDLYFFLKRGYSPNAFYCLDIKEVEKLILNQLRMSQYGESQYLIEVKESFTYFTSIPDAPGFDGVCEAVLEIMEQMQEKLQITVEEDKGQ